MEKQNLWKEQAEREFLRGHKNEKHNKKNRIVKLKVEREWQKTNFVIQLYEPTDQQQISLSPFSLSPISVNLTQNVNEKCHFLQLEPTNLNDNHCSVLFPPFTILSLSHFQSIQSRGFDWVKRATEKKTRHQKIYMKKKRGNGPFQHEETPNVWRPVCLAKVNDSDCVKICLFYLSTKDWSCIALHRLFPLSLSHYLSPAKIWNLSQFWGKQKSKLRKK